VDRAVVLYERGTLIMLVVFLPSTRWLSERALVSPVPPRVARCWKVAGARLSDSSPQPPIAASGFVERTNSHASEARLRRCAPPAGPSSVQVLIFLPSQAESVPVELFQPQAYP
jgi:hypothetical protein